MTSAETAKGNLRLQVQLIKSQYRAELLEAAGGSLTPELGELYDQFCARIDEMTTAAEQEIDGMEAFYNAARTTIEQTAEACRQGEPDKATQLVTEFLAHHPQ